MKTKVYKYKNENEIYAYSEAGYSYTEIAEEFGIHRNTVYRMVKRWKEKGDRKQKALELMKQMEIAQ